MSKSLSFDSLIPALSESLLEVIISKDHFGFSKMTPVQAASIPLFLNHKDGT
jgi:superfamily II DNA/RNA helicase